MQRCLWAGVDPRMRTTTTASGACCCTTTGRCSNCSSCCSTILFKRGHYRTTFDGFDAAKMARYIDKRVGRLLANAGIVRNRLKIAAAIENARAFLQVQRERGSFDACIESFVDGHPIRNRRCGDVPAVTKESDAMSKDLRRRGFRFVGSTICYAFIQSAGLVNDHVVTCFRYAEL